MPKKTSQLRHHAEKLLRSNLQESPALRTDVKTQRLIHELDVYRISLEMQNEELRNALEQLEILRNKYSDLYDFTAVGYFTLDPHGMIREINLAGARMLGQARAGLLKKQLSRYVFPPDRKIYEQLRNQLVETGELQRCELRLLQKDAPPSWVRVEATIDLNAAGTPFSRTVFSDINELKQTEQLLRTREEQLRLIHQDQGFAQEKKVRERTNDLLKVNKLLEEEVYERSKVEDKLRKSQDQLRELSTHILNIREDERTAIAREIHDELGQVLAALKFDVSMLAANYRDHQQLAAKTGSMEQMISESIKTVQRISSELRPVMLDELGLAEALEWQADNFQQRTGIACKIIVLLMEKTIRRELATAVFRIYQESLTNVLRHSGASQVDALLIEKKGRIVLAIRDNGVGILEHQKNAPLSFGVIGMRERAYALGGKMKICGLPKSGTLVIVRIPL